MKKELSNLHHSEVANPSQELLDSTTDTREHQRIFSPESKVVDSVLAIAWQSWQSPVDGVPELVKSVVALLLEAYHEENRLLGICESKVSQAGDPSVDHYL